MFFFVVCTWIHLIVTRQHCSSAAAKSRPTSQRHNVWRKSNSSHHYSKARTTPRLSVWMTVCPPHVRLFFEYQVYRHCAVYRIPWLSTPHPSETRWLRGARLGRRMGLPFRDGAQFAGHPETNGRRGLAGTEEGNDVLWRAKHFMAVTRD